MTFLTRIPLTEIEKKQRQQANKCYLSIRTQMIRHSYVFNEAFSLGLRVIALYMVTYDENDIIKSLTINFVETLKKISIGLNITFQKALKDFILNVYKRKKNSIPENIALITLQDIQCCTEENRKKLRKELRQYYYCKIREALMEKRVQQDSSSIVIPHYKK